MLSKDVDRKGHVGDGANELTAVNRHICFPIIIRMQAVKTDTARAMSVLIIMLIFAQSETAQDACAAVTVLRFVSAKRVIFVSPSFG